MLTSNFCEDSRHYAVVAVPVCYLTVSFIKAHGLEQTYFRHSRKYE